MWFYHLFGVPILRHTRSLVTVGLLYTSPSVPKAHVRARSHPKQGGSASPHPKTCATCAYHQGEETTIHKNAFFHDFPVVFLKRSPKKKSARFRRPVVCLRAMRRRGQPCGAAALAPRVLCGAVDLPRRRLAESGPA